MKNIIILPFALLLVMLISTCNKERFCNDPNNPICPNFDPCLQAVPANSNFQFVAVVPNITDTLIDINIDTSYSGGNAVYKALVTEGLETYAWKVGADPRVFTEPELYLDFTAFTGDISVTLETTALNTGICLEESQLKDVKTKQIHYANRSRTAPIFGIFKGRLVGDVDGTEYEIQVDNSLPPFRRLHGLPLPDDCNFDARGIPLYFGYQYFVSNFLQEGPTPRCRELIVVGRIDLEDSNQLRIEYVYLDDDGDKKEAVFIGRRQ
jgi:hypothetical protein